MIPLAHMSQTQTASRSVHLLWTAHLFAKIADLSPAYHAIIED